MDLSGQVKMAAALASSFCMRLWQLLLGIRVSQPIGWSIAASSWGPPLHRDPLNTHSQSLVAQPSCKLMVLITNVELKGMVTAQWAEAVLTDLPIPPLINSPLCWLFAHGLAIWSATLKTIFRQIKKIPFLGLWIVGTNCSYWLGHLVKASSDMT